MTTSIIAFSSPYTHFHCILFLGKCIPWLDKMSSFVNSQATLACCMPRKRESQRHFRVLTASRNWMYRVCQLGLLQATWNIWSWAIPSSYKAWQLRENNLPGNKRESHPVGLVNAERTATKLLGATGYTIQSKPVIVPLHPQPPELLLSSYILMSQL